MCEDDLETRPACLDILTKPLRKKPDKITYTKHFPTCSVRVAMKATSSDVNSTENAHNKKKTDTNTSTKP